MKTNARAAGVDGRTVAQTAELLAARQEDILALISAGRYRPEAVKAVDIPKVNGGTRRLGRWLTARLSKRISASP